MPSKDEYINELKRLKALTDIARSQQKEIVVVTGEGLSTPVMAARIADSKTAMAKILNLLFGVKIQLHKITGKLPA